MVCNFVVSILTNCYGIGASALQAAIAAVSKYGGASEGYRTLLDALIPASKILQEVSLMFYFAFFIEE